MHQSAPQRSHILHLSDLQRSASTTFAAMKAAARCSCAAQAPVLPRAAWSLPSRPACSPTAVSRAQPCSRRALAARASAAAGGIPSLVERSGDGHYATSPVRGPQGVCSCRHLRKVGKVSSGTNVIAARSPSHQSPAAPRAAAHCCAQSCLSGLWWLDPHCTAGDGGRASNCMVSRRHVARSSCRGRMRLSCAGTW